MKEIALQYSGGTDSTAAAVLAAGHFKRVHLLTYHHSGLHRIENSMHNIARLRRAFPDVEFRQLILDVDGLFRSVTYSNYVANLREYGLFNLGTCGFCKLSMHLRTLVYCLEYGIKEVADGANVNSSHFPAQMAEVIIEVRKMYHRFGITYSNPVFEYHFPGDIDWYHKLGLPALADRPEGKRHTVQEKTGDPTKSLPPGASWVPPPPEDDMTTGRLLYLKGILPEENVKGKAEDRKMQARCFQLTLLNAFALGYYIPRYGMERYRERTTRFYQHKIAEWTVEVEAYLREKETSKLYRILGGKT